MRLLIQLVHPLFLGPDPVELPKSESMTRNHQQDDGGEAEGETDSDSQLAGMARASKRGRDRQAA